MQKRIYLHIGPAKSGTSTIQVGLTNNRLQLDELGWFFPTESRKHLPSRFIHQNAMRQIKESSSYNVKYDSLAELLASLEATDKQKMFVTSEFIWNMQPHKIEMMRQIFANFDVIVIAYFRHQASILQSWWMQMSKRPRYSDVHVRGEDFTTYVIRHLKKSRKNKLDDRYNYYYRLMRWVNVFGQENIRIRVLEKPQLQGHLFEDFLRTCDVTDLSTIRIPQNQNISPGPKTLSLLRTLLPRIQDQVDIESSPAHRRLSTQISKFIIQSSIQHGWDANRASFISADIFEKVDHHYATSNREVAQMFFSREELFLAPFEEKPVSTGDVGDLATQDWMNLIADLIPSLLMSS
jgi:hypothetical protein